MGPTYQGHVNAQSAGHVGGLKWVLKIWIPLREPISKFRNIYECIVGDCDRNDTSKLISTKFEDRQCIKLKKKDRQDLHPDEKVAYSYLR